MKNSASFSLSTILYVFPYLLIVTVISASGISVSEIGSGSPTERDKLAP